MSKRPARLIVTVFFYFIVGIFEILLCYFGIKIIFLVTGSVCIILSFGLFKLLNWARVASLILSSYFILMYILLIIGTVKGYWRGWGGIGLLVNFPILLLGLITIDSLTRPKIKELFKKKVKIAIREITQNKHQ